MIPCTSLHVLPWDGDHVPYFFHVFGIWMDMVKLATVTRQRLAEARSLSVTAKASRGASELTGPDLHKKSKYGDEHSQQVRWFCQGWCVPTSSTSSMINGSPDLESSRCSRITYDIHDNRSMYTWMIPHNCGEIGEDCLVDCYKLHLLCKKKCWSQCCFSVFFLTASPWRVLVKTVLDTRLTVTEVSWEIRVLIGRCITKPTNSWIKHHLMKT